MKNKAHSPYFVNPFVDFSCMGALSIAALLGFWLAHGSVLNYTAALVAAYLAWVINWPHFSATNLRLFRRSANWKQFPLTAFCVPLLALAGALASFADPVNTAPYFLKIFILWSPYHFSGQNVGLSLLYAKRAGFEFENWERRALTWFTFSTFLATALAGEVAGSSTYYEVTLPSFHLAPWVGRLGWYALYASSAACLFALGRRLVQRKAFFPAIVLVPPVAQFCWFVVGWRVPSFYYFVPMFHSLQYLLVAWAMHLAERRTEVKTAPAGFVWKQTALWAGINIVGGVALFWGLPQLAVWRGISLPLATGVLIAAVQIHHFIVDGVIWKLRNPKVATALVGTKAAFAPRKKAA